MRKRGYILLLALAIAAVWGCNKDKDKGLTVQPSQLWGEWQQNETQNYWTFKEDYTGNKVNRGEFDTIDENNGNFTWVINGGDELELEFKGSGELGGIDIVKLFTITGINTNAMTWEDVYGRTMSLTRVIKEE